MSSPPLSVLWAAAAAALLLAGCGDGPAAPARQTFADASAPIFSAAALEREREVFMAGPEAAWSFAGMEARETEHGWVATLEEVGPAASIRLDLGLEAQEADVLELEVEAAPPLGEVEILWRGDGGAGRASAALGLLGKSLRVRPKEAWSGTVRQLEWRWPRLPDGQRLLIRGFKARRTEPDSQRLATALGKAWRVDIGRTLRPALLGIPGVHRELSARVPESGVFRVFLGATAARPATTFRVSATAAGGSRSFELLDERIEGEALSSWSERVLDLGALAGREVTLRLAIEAEAPWVPGEGLPVWGGPSIGSGAGVAATSPSGARPPDLILVSADTLRADHLSLYGYSRPTSPHLDAWASDRAVVFERAIAPSPWTLPSHTTLFTGLGVLEHGVSYGTPAPGRLRLLAERLRAAGYATYAETGGGYLHPAYGLGRGFDVFRYPESQVPGPRDLEEAVERARAFAEARSEPVFLFLHSYETHEPYTARQPHLLEIVGGREASAREAQGSSTLLSVRYVTRWVEPRVEDGFSHRRRFVRADAAGDTPVEDPAPVVDLYDGRVRSLDAQLAGLFSWFEGRQDSRPTALVLTSDHGESLGEDGRGGHASLEEQILHIPLVLALPGGRAGGRVLAPRVRLADVAPTLLELAGISGEASSGESLLALLEAEAAASRPAWSASPSTNAGVTLEVGERGRDWRLRRRASAWAEEGGLSHHAPEGGLQEPTVKQRAASDRRILQRLEAHARGLELLFANRGDQPLRLRLEGSSLQNHRVKSWDAPRGRVRWLGQAEGVAVEVLPGDRWRLFVRTAGAVGDLEARVEGGEGWHLDLARATLPMVLEREGKGWSQRAGEDVPAAGVRLRWRGDGAEDEESSAEVADELQRQLEALGYVG
ncbi:MAG: sulfatase [Acidobacteriota bacterium]